MAINPFHVLVTIFKVVFFYTAVNLTQGFVTSSRSNSSSVTHSLVKFDACTVLVTVQYG